MKAQHLKNPFQFGTVVREDNFCNRVEELKLLKSYILDGYSVWLYSPRRYGKSSLIKKVFKEVSGVKTLYFDLYNIHSIEDFCNKYSSLLIRELFDKRLQIKELTSRVSQYLSNLYPVVSFDETGSLSLSLQKKDIGKQSDIETILQIPSKIGQLTKTQICIAFDEFQEIDRIDPFLKNWMRSVFQYQEGVSYVFLGSQQSLMEAIFSDIKSPFYEFALKMKINPISGEDFSPFIKRKFLDSGLEIDSSTIDDILSKSEGYPHFVQYFASVVFNMLRNGEDQYQSGFSDLWMERIIQGQSDIFQAIYDQLSRIQRLLLRALSRMEPDEEIYSESSRKKYSLPGSSSLLSAIESLMKKSLIIKTSTSYKILNPVFKVWVNQLG